ncbi:D-tyrosyl-tRNA(Tyr) deacylase [Oxobacter pfennigii]|uniref:D-aminoacyl-tRNA deacylase n=1 Tax=Oxobacter pfennigii TaxID=36849 RepID=A0A0N8NTJ2_9CLOT|nr:D-aminoacyl-tRNA deacylase [Oxobacter pfennigii]KPU44984.1 D-tyrosyl-tRNA(Tyr) deacylase [Oxobacter pfennigii]
MRAVVQRVDNSEVIVDEKIKGSINCGLAVFLGVEEGDTEEDSKYLADKIINLRIFEDENDKMNLSLLDIKGEILAVSQFTLLGDCRKGRRPNFMAAAKPETAVELYNKFIDYVRINNIKVETGVFQAHMTVKIINNGPVTILLDSRKNF